MFVSADIMRQRRYTYLVKKYNLKDEIHDIQDQINRAAENREHKVVIEKTWTNQICDFLVDALVANGYDVYYPKYTNHRDDNSGETKKYLHIFWSKHK